MPRATDVYEPGNFFQHLVAPCKPTVEDMISNRDYFGLEPNLTILYACMRTEDGEMFELLRNFTHATGEDGEKHYSTLVVQSTEIDGENLVFDMAKTEAAAPSMNARIEQDGERGVWRPGEGVQGNPFEIRFGEEECSWVEEGFCNLSGPLIKPGIQTYLPGRDYGTYYLNNLGELKGEIMGRKAHGMFGFDRAFMGKGATLYSDKDVMLENKGHILWWMFGTRYEDGSADVGQIIVGHDRMGFAMVTDGGKNVIVTNNVEAVVTPETDGPYAEYVEATIDGERWEFLPDPRGKMPGMLAKYPPTPQQEGRWQRVGETRKPAAWFAWGEIEKGHGLTRQPRLPTRV